MEGRGMTLMRSSMVLPSMLCILVLVFVLLLALEVHVEVAQQFTGPSQRTLAEAVCAPKFCVDPLEAASDTMQASVSEVPPANNSGQAIAARKASKIDGPSTSRISKSDIQGDHHDSPSTSNGSGGRRSTPVEQKYAFKMHEPGSMGHEDMEWCPGLRTVDLKPMDEKLEFLMILGAQKAGTTWLHTELQRHDLFQEAASAYKLDVKKEIRFFNSYPVGTTQQYLDLFPANKVRKALDGKPTVFLDSTPEYLFSPSVAPRVKQMIPNAKFVVVMRDPVARTVSSHNMLQSVLQQDDYCVKGTNGEKLCRPVQSLLDLARSSAALNIDWPENLSGCNFNSTVEDPEERRTWGDCWRCDQHIDDCDELSAKEARAVGGCTPNQMPLVPDMPLTHFGMYAPQLAWWLSFFPPENFVVLTSEELHDPDRVAPALNRILKVVGHSEAESFTKEQILSGNNKGFKGKYSGEKSEEDKQAEQELAQFFERPNKDLQTLMDTFFPESNFSGFS